MPNHNHPKQQPSIEMLLAQKRAEEAGLNKPAKTDHLTDTQKEKLAYDTLNKNIDDVDYELRSHSFMTRMNLEEKVMLVVLSEIHDMDGSTFIRKLIKSAFKNQTNIDTNHVERVRRKETQRIHAELLKKKQRKK